MTVNKNIHMLTEDDLEELFVGRRISFLDTSDYSDPAARQRMLGRLPFIRGYFEDGRLASAATMFPFKMHFAGEVIRVGGLAGVLTPPEHRRKGYVRELLWDGLERLHAEKVGWCLEHPFDPRFYGRFGWQSVTSGVRLKVPCEWLLDKQVSVEATRLTDVTTEDLTPLKEIHKAWAQHYNFPLSRDDASERGWNHIIQQIRNAQNGLIYLFDEAYCMLELKSEPETEVNVRDYAYSSPGGRRQLFAFLGLFSGQAEQINILLPPDEPLRLLLQRFQKGTHPDFQARIVDVQAAFRGLRSKDAFSMALRVHDDFCAWNDGSFLLELSEEGSDITPSHATPDLHLDIQTLTALLCGSLSADAALRAGLIEGSLHHARMLTTLAGGRQPFISVADFF